MEVVSPGYSAAAAEARARTGLGAQVRDRISGYDWSTGVTDMELFEPILGMTMIVVGLVMVLGGMGLLFYSIWTGGRRKSQSGPIADGHVEVEPS